MKNSKLITRIALLSILSFGLFSFLNADKTEPYKIGDTVENFGQINIDGTSVELADYKKESGLILIFTCNTCPYAVAYEDRIIALHEKYKEQGFPVLAINPNNPEAQPGDSIEEMQARAEEKGFTFPYLLDVGQEIYPKFGATKTPHVFLLAVEKDEFVLKYIGAIDDNYKDAAQVKEPFLENAINAILKGEDIKPTQTRAIGCTIKT